MIRFPLANSVVRGSRFFAKFLAESNSVWVENLRPTIVNSINRAIRMRPIRKSKLRRAPRRRSIRQMLAAAALMPLLVASSYGDGTFASPQTFAAEGDPRSVNTGDFNGDGVADLATANGFSNNVSVLLGVGDGTFAAQVAYAALDVPASVTTGDFDGDGKTDLAIANQVSNNVSVLLGVGDGTFAPRQPIWLETLPFP